MELMAKLTCKRQDNPKVGCDDAKSRLPAVKPNLKLPLSFRLVVAPDVTSCFVFQSCALLGEILFDGWFETSVHRARLYRSPQGTQRYKGGAIRISPCRYHIVKSPPQSLHKALCSTALFLQSLSEALPIITLYCKAWDKYSPRTSHFTLQILLQAPHSTLHTAHCTPDTTHYTLHLSFCAPHSTIHTPDFSLRTCHSTLFILYTLHPTLHAAESTHLLKLAFRIGSWSVLSTKKHQTFHLKRQERSRVEKTCG